MTSAPSTAPAAPPARIAFLIDGSENYGVLQMMSLILETVDRRPFRMVGIFLGRGPARDQLAALCDEVIDLGMGCLLPLSRAGYSKYNVPNMVRKSLLFVRAVIAATAALRRAHIDLVHVHMYPLHLVAGLACRLRPTACVWHWHSSFDRHRKFHMIARLAFGPLATCVVCISRFVAGTLPESGQRKARVVYNAVKYHELRARQRPGQLRALLAIPPARPLVSIVGSLTEYKGHEYFVRAAAAVLRDFPDTHFAIIGREMDVQRHRFGREARLRRLVADLGITARILFFGHLDDSALYMCDCDIVCVPTIPLGIGGEGFGLVLTEAMTAGVPVVATSCGAPPEIIEDGVSGLLVPPRDSDELARAMVFLLSSEERRKAIGAAGQQRVIDRFDSSRMAREVAALYQECLAHTHGRRSGDRTTSS
jgi:glycosyltransferase involved in cell wall biosynthesis